jgi:peptidylprolyl isomerase
MNLPAIPSLTVPLLLIAFLLTAGCTGPEAASPVPAVNGDTVLVHYTGTLDNGEVFDSSQGRDPLRFTLGAGSMIPEFEEAIIGMSTGEEKTFTIMAEQAYGPKTLEIEKTRIAMEDDLQVGQQLHMVTEEGRVMMVAVTAIGNDTVSVENTHRLAGENLTFSVRLVGIEGGS